MSPSQCSCGYSTIAETKEFPNNPDEATVSIVNMHFNIYELLGLHNIHMSCSKQSPEYQCDTNSHKMRHVVINVAACLVPRVNTRIRGTCSY